MSSKPNTKRDARAIDGDIKRLKKADGNRRASSSSSASSGDYVTPHSHPNIHRITSIPQISDGNYNNLICNLLTDLYQITMCYAYWKAEKTADVAVFDLFFRKNPFHGEYTIFAGLEDVLRFVNNFHFSDGDIEYLREAMGPDIDPAFFEYLRHMTAKDIELYAIDEGSVVFPRVPLIRVEGPLPVVQLLETTFLTLVNYASLVATNACRFRVAAGSKAKLLEFGLRRAQGPDGGVTASKYCYIGGFDATSNVLAGKLFGIPIAGTHAHSFVSSFNSLGELKVVAVKRADGSMCENFVEVVQSCHDKLSKIWPDSPAQCHLSTSEKELAAFAAYAIAFPSTFLALIDTYDTLRSGCPNYIAVAMALIELGHTPKGLRLDSGDLAYLSIKCREYIDFVAKKLNMPLLAKSSIVASNDINEPTILSLQSQGHAINAYGVGTHLVTCQAQPALGAVYKLVQVNDKPCMKLSADVSKVSMPGRKSCYRLYGREGNPVCDLLLLSDEKPPAVDQAILCRHPFVEQKRAYVRPTKVESLLNHYFSKGKVVRELPSIKDIRKKAQDSIRLLRQDHTRSLNPTPYKVSVNDELYTFIHKMWLDSAPVGELS